MSELIRHRDIRPGQLVECPRTAGIGAHVATVTHADPVGTGAPRTAVTLSCGHVVNMSDAHGLYAAPDSTRCPVTGRSASACEDSTHAGCVAGHRASVALDRATAPLLPDC